MSFAQRINTYRQMVRLQVPNSQLKQFDPTGIFYLISRNPHLTPLELLILKKLLYSQENS